MEAWNQEKERRHCRAQLVSSSRSSPEDQVRDSAGSPSCNPLSNSIYVELQSKSDFLECRPDFDTNDVVPISASQLSQFPHSDSDIELPPTQFFVVSSQPSQDICIADSQPIPSEDSPHWRRTATPARGGNSQRTIPDSQEISTDFSQNLVEVPATAEAAHQASAHSPKASHDNSSGSSIPSRQPDGNKVSFGYLSTSIDTEPLPLSQQDLPLPPPPSTLQPQTSARPEFSRSTFSVFLTQPDFEPGEFSLSTESRSQSQTQGPRSTTEIQASIRTTGAQPTATLAQDLSLDISLQPAQRVSPLPGQDRHFRSQSESEFFSASEVVLDTSQQQASGQSQQQQPGSPCQPVTSIAARYQPVSHSFAGAKRR